MRITNNIIYNTALTNLDKQSSRLFRTQEESASGKKILHLSDDPISTYHIFDFRQKLIELNQFQTNRSTLKAFLSATDNSLQSSEGLLQRAQELALAGLNDGMSDADRQTMAQEVAGLFAQAITLGNADLSGRYLFAGSAGDSQLPMSNTGTFSGNNQELALDMRPGQALVMNVLASQFLTSDLRPHIDPNTPLASLNQGRGVDLGSISITDRAGNHAVIDVSSAVTIDDLLVAISNAPGLNVNAAINTAGNGISIVDSSASPIRNLMVTEVDGGSTASDLGILADRPGNIVGTTLRPAVTASTPLGLLHQGQGGTFSIIRITNGATDVEVDLSAALTIGDVLTAIDAAGANVTASLNATGTALEVRSNDPTTVAIVTPVGGDTTVEDLGIQGGHDTLKTLKLLQEALEKSDRNALNRLLTHLDASVNQVAALRSDVGVRLNRVQMAEEQEAHNQFTVTSWLSQTQDADAAETFSRLSYQAFLFEAALASTAQIVRPTLLDFLR